MGRVSAQRIMYGMVGWLGGASEGAPLPDAICATVDGLKSATVDGLESAHLEQDGQRRIYISCRPRGSLCLSPSFPSASASCLCLSPSAFLCLLPSALLCLLPSSVSCLPPSFPSASTSCLLPSSASYLLHPPAFCPPLPSAFLCLLSPAFSPPVSCLCCLLLPSALYFPFFFNVAYLVYNNVILQ